MVNLTLESLHYDTILRPVGVRDYVSQFPAAVVPLPKGEIVVLTGPEIALQHSIKYVDF